MQELPTDVLPTTPLPATDINNAGTVGAIAAGANETMAAVEETITQPLNTEPAAALDNTIGATVPAPGVGTTDDTASNKSVGISADNGSVAVDTSGITNIQLPNTDESAAVLVDGDTDALAQDLGQEVPIDQIVIEPVAVPGAEPVTNGIAVTEPNRAIENERWVLFQSPTKFTVQLATSRERGYIIDLAQTMQVNDPCLLYTSPSPRDRG